MSRLAIHKTPLDGVLLIEPATRHEDFRGEYVEIYNETLYHSAGVTTKFVEDDISVSTRHVLRGLHGDNKTAKLVSCLHGRFHLIIVNNDQTSSQYRRWTSFDLSDRNRLQVFIPPKFANGHLVMSDWTIFHYKQSSYYDRASQFTLLWNDPALGLRWPIANPIVSERDSGIG